MQTYTLTVILNDTLDKVLMCWHCKQGAYNFVGGKVEVGETLLEASYREVFEETGITKQDIELQFLREETVFANPKAYCYPWHMVVTFGVLHSNAQLRSEKNPLLWMDTSDERLINATVGLGNCIVYLNEVFKVLGR